VHFVHGMREIMLKGKYSYKSRIPGADIFIQENAFDEAYLIHGIIIIFLFVMVMERLQFRMLSSILSNQPFLLIRSPFLTCTGETCGCHHIHPDTLGAAD